MDETCTKNICVVMLLREGVYNRPKYFWTVAIGCCYRELVDDCAVNKFLSSSINPEYTYNVPQVNKASYSPNTIVSRHGWLLLYNYLLGINNKCEDIIVKTGEGNDLI